MRTEFENSAGLPITDRLRQYARDAALRNEILVMAELNANDYFDLETMLGSPVSTLPLLGFAVRIDLIRGPDQKSMLQFRAAIAS
jgi:hypothetical protein